MLATVETTDLEELCHRAADDVTRGLALQRELLHGMDAEARNVILAKFEELRQSRTGKGVWNWIGSIGGLQPEERRYMVAHFLRAAATCGLDQLMLKMGVEELAERGVHLASKPYNPAPPAQGRPPESTP